jgi:hypothetical protein
MKKILLCLLLVTNTLQAKEIDQLMAWNTTIEDSTVTVNKFYNDLITDFVAKNSNAGGGGRISCGWTIFKLTLTINGVYSKNTLGYFRSNKDAIKAFPAWEKTYEEIYEESIFNGVEMFHPDLSRIIKVNDIKIGTDKVAHFFGMGFLYWLSYQKTYSKFKRKLGHEAAHKKAINAAISSGIKAEKGIIGWKSQKTASFADLEANYQGLKFLLNFCSGDDPMVKAVKVPGKLMKRWKMVKPFDFRNYVGPWWDESFYSNLYTPEAFEIIRPNMVKHCEMRRSSEIESLFTHYNTNHTPSYSVKYLSELIEKGELEDNYLHSIDHVCDELEKKESSIKQMK